MVSRMLGLHRACRPIKASCCPGSATIVVSFSLEYPHSLCPAAAEVQPQRPSKPSLPPPTAKQLRTIANGNALQLVELWKAAFVGSRLYMAGTFGEVLATGLVSKCEAEACMQLDYSTDPESGSAIVSAVVSGATGEQNVTRSKDGICSALLGRAGKEEDPFLIYKLPALAAVPPLLMAVTVREKPKQRGRGKPPALQSQLSSRKDQDNLANGKPESELSEPRHAKNGSDGRPAVEQIASDSGEIRRVSASGNEMAGLSEGIQVQFEGDDSDVSRAPTSNSTPAGGSDAKQSATPQVAVEFSPAVAEKAQQIEPVTETGVPIAKLHSGSSLNDARKQQTPRRQNRSISEEQEPKQEESNQLRTAEPNEEPDTASEPDTKLWWLVTVHLAVSPSVGGPLRGVCVDLDLGHKLGDLVRVAPGAQWASKQRRLRWQLYQLDAGSRLKLQVMTRPSHNADLSHTSTSVMAALHAFGPPATTLSGIHLSSGAVFPELKPSRSAFHCEVTAKPEAAKQRGTLGKQERINQAIQQFEAQHQAALHHYDAGDPGDVYSNGNKFQ